MRREIIPATRRRSRGEWWLPEVIAPKAEGIAMANESA